MSVCQNSFKNEKRAVEEQKSSSSTKSCYPVTLSVSHLHLSLILSILVLFDFIWLVVPLMYSCIDCWEGPCLGCFCCGVKASDSWTKRTSCRITPLTCLFMSCQILLLLVFIIISYLFLFSLTLIRNLPGASCSSENPCCFMTEA